MHAPCSSWWLYISDVGFQHIVLQNLDKSCNINDHKVYYFLQELFILLHTLLNPLAYALCTKKFKRSLRRLCKGLGHNGNNETVESTRSPRCKLFSLIKTTSWRIFLLIIILFFLSIIWLNCDFQNVFEIQQLPLC